MDTFSFQPVTASQTRIVVLGSIPGIKSIEQHQYYAHPRNAFWPIMASVLGFDDQLSYQKRLAELTRHQISLWDVLGYAQRAGSLDSAIDKSTEQVNDFANWFFSMPDLQAVLLNGGTAFQRYQKYVVKQDKHPESVRIYQLPSTSPAYAAMRFEQKLSKWRDVLNRHL